MAYQILNKTSRAAEIHLYDDIGEGWFGGVSAKAFADDIKKLGDVAQIDLRINSPGGSVFDGVTMYNVLVANKARVITHIDGLAASIASIIAMAGDEIRMASNALMMIHDPWGMIVGSSEDMHKEAEVLDTVKQTLIDTYAKRTNMERGAIAEMMREETWMNADEASKFGFVDTVTEQALMAASADVSRYKYRHLPEEFTAQQGKRAQRDARLTRIAAATNRLVPQAIRNRR